MESLIKFTILGAKPRPSRAIEGFLNALMKITGRKKIPNFAFRSRSRLWNYFFSEPQKKYNVFLSKNPSKLKVIVKRHGNGKLANVPRGRYEGSARKRKNYKSSVFGPIFWTILHKLSLEFDNKDVSSWKKLVKNLDQALPCIKCRKNLRMEKSDCDFSSKRKVISFFVKIHNQVNDHLGKKRWSVTKAENFYKDLRYFSFYVSKKS